MLYEDEGVGEDVICSAVEPSCPECPPMYRRLDDGTAEVTTIVGSRQAKSVERRESALYGALG